jgi:hypothetical protein
MFFKEISQQYVKGYRFVDFTTKQQKINRYQEYDRLCELIYKTNADYIRYGFQKVDDDLKKEMQELFNDHLKVEKYLKKLQ